MEYMINKIEEPKTFEEAKIIIKNSVNDELEKSNMKYYRHRAMFNVGLVTAAAGVLGIALNSIACFAGLLPVTGIVALTSLQPIFQQRTTNERIKNDVYFKDKTEAYIIEVAKDYTNQFNEFADKYNEKGSRRR